MFFFACRCGYVLTAIMTGQIRRKYDVVLQPIGAADGGL
jgi:hypothetical protein